MFILARNGQYLSAPLDHPGEKRILDLGCGTGIWAIDVAESVTCLPAIDLHLSGQLTYFLFLQTRSHPTSFCAGGGSRADTARYVRITLCLEAFNNADVSISFCVGFRAMLSLYKWTLRGLGNQWAGTVGMSFTCERSLAAYTTGDSSMIR